VHGITGLRFLPQGSPATLVNISSTGLLAESTARLAVGSSATVAIDGGFKPARIEGRVARCEVAVMGRDGLLRYHLGIEFTTPLPALEDDRPAPAAAARAPHAVNRW
jgi:hypothetical protein